MPLIFVSSGLDVGRMFKDKGGNGSIEWISGRDNVEFVVVAVQYRKVRNVVVSGKLARYRLVSYSDLTRLRPQGMTAIAKYVCERATSSLSEMDKGAGRVWRLRQRRVGEHCECVLVLSLQEDPTLHYCKHQSADAS